MRLLDLAGRTAGEILRVSDVPRTKEGPAQKVAQLGLPGKKSEEYRYFPIESLLTKAWERYVPDDGAPKIGGDRILFVDGALSEVPDGVDVEEGSLWNENHFDPLYHVGHLLTKRTYLLRFQKDRSVVVEHRFTRPEVMMAYRVGLTIAPNVHVAIEERFTGEGADGSFVLGGYDVVVGRDATLRIVGGQTLQKGDYRPIFSHAMRIEERGTLAWHTFDFGGGEGLRLAHVCLKESAWIRAYHLLYAHDEGRRGLVSKIVHEGTSARSDQQAKTILDDRARGIFDALIKVENSGKYAKAHQNSKAILLHEGAYMAAKPQLEIYIDDLEASHGATTGELDENQLFYLRSRGIDKEEARKMLILAFANEMIDALEDDVQKEAMHAAFEQAYYGRTQLTCIQTCHGCENEILKG